MNTQNQLDPALETLRQEHLSIQPPASLRGAILRQSKLSVPRRTHALRNWSLGLAAAAAITIAVVLLYPRPTRPAIDARTTPISPPRSIQVPSPLDATMQPSPSRSHSKHQPYTRTRSFGGGFVPLPNGVGLPEPTQALVIRTRIETSSLRSYGLTPPPPGAPQSILAEFLVGEDGLPRAVRLVP